MFPLELNLSEYMDKGREMICVYSLFGSICYNRFADDN